MSDTKFTKGPWEIKPEELERNYIRIRGLNLGGKYKIANVLGTCMDGKTYDSIEEVRANAHLIAAAPDMYEALIITIGALKEVCDVRGAPLPNSTILRAEAALAKARGES